MKYLADTHVFLWWMADPEQLSKAVTETLFRQPGEVAFSAVSGWEIAVKSSIGKLGGVPIDRLEEELSAQGWRGLSFTLRYLPTLASLPFHHHDPFDRALVAQAIDEDLTILTRDSKIARYDVRTRW